MSPERGVVEDYLTSLAELLSLAVAERLRRLAFPPAPPNWVELAAQLHPRVYLVMEPKVVGLQDPRGSRRFAVGQPARECEWSKLAGRTCSLPPERLQADHVWPYSLGGPTVPDNLAWLCETHNALKSAFLFGAAVDANLVWLPSHADRTRNYAIRELQLLDR